MSPPAPAAALERRSLSRGAVLLLGLTLLVLVALEVGTRQFIFRVSATLGRIQTEASAAASLRAGALGEPRQVLLVGNSLLLAAVDVSALDQALSPEWRATRFVLEQTTYHDWYFGLRRLLSAGARPDAVVICLEPRHLLYTGVRSEQFAWFLMRERDVLAVSRAADLGPAATAEIALARVSAFYALRKEIRKNIIGRLMPSLPRLMSLITAAPQPPPDSAALATTGRERLADLRDLAGETGVTVVFLVAPPAARRDAEALEAMGQDLGIAVVAPALDTELRPRHFEADRYHLNGDGRAVFTRALAPALASALSVD